MSELEWSVVAGVVGVALAGLVRLMVGRILYWRRERLREPIRAPFKLQESTGLETIEGPPARESGPAGRRKQSPQPRSEQAAPPPEVTDGVAPAGAGGGAGDTAPSLGASVAPAPAPLKSAPADLCPEDDSEVPVDAKEPAGIEGAEVQLRQLQSRLAREQERFEQLTRASGDELARALLRNGVASVAGIPPAAAQKVRQQADALQRLAEELELMERNVKRKALELVDLRRVLRRSTESGWGRRLEA